MSGHSHWAGIRYKKAAVDAKRGKLWSKVARMIIVAAKAGGGDAIVFTIPEAPWIVLPLLYLALGFDALAIALVLFYVGRGKGAKI